MEPRYLIGRGFVVLRDLGYHLTTSCLPVTGLETIVTVILRYEESILRHAYCTYKVHEQMLRAYP